MSLPSVRINGVLQGSDSLGGDASYPIDISDPSQATGIAAVPNGGSGVATLAKGSVVIGNDADPVLLAAPGDAGDVLTSNGAGVAPSFQAAGGGGGGSVTFNEQQWVGLGNWVGAACQPDGTFFTGNDNATINSSTQPGPNGKALTEAGTSGVSALDYWGNPLTYLSYDLAADSLHRCAGFSRKMNLPYGTDMATVALDVYWMVQDSGQTGDMRWWIRTFPSAAQLTVGNDMSSGDYSASWNAGQNLIDAAGGTAYLLQKSTLSPLTLTGINALDLFDLLIARQYDGVVDTFAHTVSIFGVMIRYSRTITVS